MSLTKDHSSKSCPLLDLLCKFRMMLDEANLQNKSSVKLLLSNCVMVTDMIFT